MADRGTVLIANPGADLYGSDRMVTETASALIADGFRVVVCVAESGPLVEVLRAAGAEVVRQPVPIIRKSALRPRGLLALVRTMITSTAPVLRLLRRNRPVVVVVNTITSPIWFPLARMLRIPVIGHVHEAEASAHRLVRTALALPLLFADRLIVNSRFSLGVITGALPRLGPRSVIVYNAVAGPDTAPQPPRAELTSPLRLLYVGRLSARKGPDVAVRALRQLVERGTDAELALAGAVFPGYEWFERELRAEVRAGGLTDRVHFLGFQPDRWPATAGCDIVLVPSTLDEPFGNVAVEAGLAARPQVVSDNSGLREAADNISSAVRVPAGDPTAIADAVQRITAEWDRFRADAEGDAAALAERYSRQRYGAEIIAVIDSVRRER